MNLIFLEEPPLWIAYFDDEAYLLLWPTVGGGETLAVVSADAPASGYHQIVKATTKVVGGKTRKAVTCSCGKRFTGWNDRALQSFFKHAGL